MTDNRAIEVLGIAKKMHRELEEASVLDHGAVISILNTLLQHRQLSANAAVEQAKAEQQARQMALQERFFAKQQAEEAKHTMGLVTQ